MFLIVGLGNPGVEYAATRHNIGFDMITYLSDKYNIPVNSREGKALVGKGILAGEKVMLAQPQTLYEFKWRERAGIDGLLQD